MTREGKKNRGVSCKESHVYIQRFREEQSWEGNLRGHLYNPQPGRFPAAVLKFLNLTSSKGKKVE